jgi:hypothetical protein
MFSEQKMFRLREDIRVYSDESKIQEVLMIKARQIIDFSAAYDVVDSVSNKRSARCAARDSQSMLRDEWEILDVNDNRHWHIIRRQHGHGAIAPFPEFNLIPQNYDIVVGSSRVADYKQNFNPFTYQLNIDFSMDTARQCWTAVSVLPQASFWQPSKGDRVNPLSNTPSSPVSS